MSSSPVKTLEIIECEGTWKEVIVHITALCVCVNNGLLRGTQLQMFIAYSFPLNFSR